MQAPGSSGMAPGSRLGHYEIQALLGAGGMGRVFAALDTRLGRTVAIKVLPAGPGDGASGSLMREAQAASALNHPNIVTVYEIGQIGAVEFLAMEHVAGKTVARMIGSRGMEIREALRVAIQIAGALAAAHEAGIVHRDLTPRNVMVTERGLVKVLDFGLARRSAGSGTVVPGDQPTETISTGFVTGTACYMSPEQAQGKELDGRSDIFAFGSVLYEMFTGRRAFLRDGSLLTLSAVAYEEPQPASDLHPGLPKDVQHILDTCLRKKRAERWQSITDVKLLLEGSLHDLESGEATAGRSTNTRRSRFTVALAGVMGVVVGAAAITLLSKPPAQERSPVLRRVTADGGLSAYPALSRDGSLLAFASDRGNEGHLDIWVQQIGGRELIRLTHDKVDATDPDIAPDGRRVAYRSEKNGGGVYIVPALGGEASLVAQGGRNPRFSPDGRWIAYWVGQELGGYLPGSARVFIVESGGGTPRQVGASMAAALYPVWYPRSDAVLVMGRQDGAGDVDQTLDWWKLPLLSDTPVRTGAFRQFREQGLVSPAWLRRILPLAWQDDAGDRVLFAANMQDAEGRGDAGNLWGIPIASDGKVKGSATRVTNGPGHHLQSSLGGPSDRRRMAYASLEWQLGIWERELDAERGVVRGDLKRLTAEDWYAGAPSFSTDGGAMAFLTLRLGRWSIRTRNMASGKEQTAVSEGREFAMPALSGDGTTIAYSDLNGGIFVVPQTGGAVAALCKDCGTVTGLSFDAQRIAYEPLHTEDLTVYERGVGKAAIVAHRPGKDTLLSGGQFSRDGRWLAFHSVATREGTARIWIARADGSTPAPASEWIAVTDGRALERDPVWSPNAGMVYFVSERDGFRCIWARKLDASTKRPVGEPFGVMHFHSARRSLRRTPTRMAQKGGFAIAPGRIAVNFGELTGDIWLEERSR